MERKHIDTKCRKDMMVMYQEDARVEIEVENVDKDNEHSEAIKQPGLIKRQRCDENPNSFRVPADRVNDYN